ncbi:MAG: Fe3+/spermidine/putrescine ABC transporter ATP-binding protein [Alphaproteobacteria bacterium 65-7]|nr:MAG: Fe3+/spermidine/putrescine ABC transporter ATP-binding protein [Alphaproteobacteria bacterium 65-7]
MSFLSAGHVSKSFGGPPVVEDVSLDVARGEFFALLGPSGCGKTTLLRMIAGFETPDSGVIAIDGEDMTAVPPNLRPTNMVFQSYAIFPHLNVFDNIAYGLRTRRLPKPELTRRVEAMLATVRLEGMEARAADQLSGGQRQRVALARALVRQPKILLLDEPLGALDKRLREQMQVELRLLQKKIGITFLLVTHDQEEAMSLSDRIAVMSGGKVLQVASPRELYERPNCREVADFIGEINFFPATVKTVNAEDVTVNGGVLGVVTLPRANAPQAVAAGDGVLLAIRPEHVRFAASGETGVAGEIVAATYLGERSHLHVKLPSRRAPVAVSATAPQEGSGVQLVFPPQRLMALPSAD